jgi:hypothetical protein
MVRNSQELTNFFLEKKKRLDDESKQTFSTIPLIDRDDILKLGSVLANDDVIARLRHNKKRLVWHVAMPKSGSTWVSAVMKKGLKLKGWKNINLLPTYGHREQEVAPIEILRQNGLNHNIFAAHQHCSYSEYAFDFIEKFDVKLILQVRNIADCIQSYIDHLNKGELAIPNAFLTQQRWATFSAETKLNFVVDFLVPWYIDFWAGWTAGLKDRNIPFSLIKYEELILDPSSEFYKIATYCDDSVTELEVSTWLNQSSQANTRKNKAVAGRGNSLPDWVHVKLQQLISYYPNTDFTPVGIVS